MNILETVRDRQLQWNTNTDLHMPYSRVYFQMTLSDLEPVSEIFNDMKHCAASLRQLSYLFEEEEEEVYPSLVSS